MNAAVKTDSMLRAIGRNARAAACSLQDVSKISIRSALKTMAELLDQKRSALKRENARDLAQGRKNGLSEAMLDRLTLSDKTIDAMRRGLFEVSRLKSPVGAVYDRRVRPNGLVIYKVRVPIGVIGIIYESRPNVTVDAAAICLASQNAVILRGGSEAFNSNRVLVSLFARACATAGIPRNAIQMIPTTAREAIMALLHSEENVDLVIPRGGEGLIRMVVENSRIPVIKHYKGICHIYVSAQADMKKALPIVVNAKVQRPGVCNAMETLLLDGRLAKQKRAGIVQALLEQGVTLFGDPASRVLSPAIKKATEDDWRAEYLDLRLAVRTVRDITEAIDHINTYGSRHTDAIVTESKKERALFLRLVDSSSVMVNASTRFSDGGEYGMGCEIGISTDKLHARGPMGIDDLTTYKWIVEGNGQIRK
jgi:glutamate-5-semialdehyde dehydrogenase